MSNFIQFRTWYNTLDYGFAVIGVRVSVAKKFKSRDTTSVKVTKIDGYFRRYKIEYHFEFWFQQSSVDEVGEWRLLPSWPLIYNQIRERDISFSKLNNLSAASLQPNEAP